jgi:curli biogenesis system outer membrane secretion channel CsgG
MKRYYLFLILSVFLFSCTGLLKMTKKAVTYEQAGMYKEASECYMNALNIKSTHMEASMGLKRSGQLVLDVYLAEFFKVHSSKDYKTSVYSYLKSVNWSNRVYRYNLSLNTPGYYLTYYNDDLEIYLSQLYEEALSDLDKELFYSAKSSLSEIIRLKPSYKDAKELKSFAHLEPIYRKGTDALDARKYRKAYYLFTQTSSYKDSQELIAYSLKEAQFPIALMPFENGSSTLNAHKAFQSQFNQTFIKNKNPFIVVTDRTHIQTILAEQELGISGMVDGQTAAQAGDLFGVKALLTGTVVAIDVQQNKVSSTRRKGWEKYSGTEKVEIKGKMYDIPVAKFKKVYYNSYYGKNIVTLSVEYKLISTETGEVLANNMITKKYDHEVSFCGYEGKNSKLYQGNWESKSTESTIDTRVSNRSKIKKLLNANRNLRSISDLKLIGFKAVCLQAVEEINSYNPEEN